MIDTLRIVLTLYPEAGAEETGRWPGDDEACSAALNAIPGALIGDDIIIRSMTAEVVRAAAEQPAAPPKYINAEDDPAVENAYQRLDLSAVPHPFRASVAFLAGWKAALADRAPPGPAQPGAAPAKFKIGDSARKTKGSQWSGRVVGTYSTDLTPEGYAVESSTEQGSVQIYPASALCAVAAPLPAVPQPAPALSQEEQWNRAGFEPYKFHPSASHVDPAYRDGWNAALRAVERAATKAYSMAMWREGVSDTSAGYWMNEATSVSDLEASYGYWRAATLAASTPAGPLIPLSAALAAVPPGSWCDPQKVADDLRAIPVAAPQADAADAARYRWLRDRAWVEASSGGWRSDYQFPLIGRHNDAAGNGTVFRHDTLDAAIDAHLPRSAPTEPAAEPAKGDAL